MTPESARDVAHLMASGVWTHDHPLLAHDLAALGLPVRLGVPPLERGLMELYPQPRGRTPAVEYSPGPPSPSLPPRREVPRPAPARQLRRPRALAPAVAVPAGRPGGREVDQRADRGVAVVGRAPDEPGRHVRPVDERERDDARVRQAAGHPTRGP